MSKTETTPGAFAGAAKDIDAALAARERADAAYAEARETWSRIEARHAALTGTAAPGDVLDRLVALARAHGPRVAALLGGPAAGAAAATFLADDGGFTGIDDVFSRIGGLLF